MSRVMLFLIALYEVSYRDSHRKSRGPGQGNLRAVAFRPRSMPNAHRMEVGRRHFVLRIRSVCPAMTCDVDGPLGRRAVATQ